MRVLVVDDERNSREGIVSIINLFERRQHEIFEASTVLDAIDQINHNSPDIVFLDIHLKDGSGFDVLDKVRMSENFAIIFVTAFDGYAFKAFKYAALDYILKPIDADELIEVLQKAKEKVQQMQLSQQIDVFFQYYNKSRANENPRITLRTSDAIYVVKVQDIIYCEASQSYTVFYLSTGEEIVVSKSIGEYEDMLNNNNFMRVHQSYLLNMSYVTRFHKEDNGYLITSTNHKIPVSVRKKTMVLNYLDHIK